MKKLSKLGLIIVAFIMIICMTGKVQAASNCAIRLTASKNNNEVVVNVNLSNIQSDKGIIGINGTLVYDDKVLKFERIEGQNTWKTPVEGVDFNKAEGIFLTTREGGFAKSDETVLKIVFSIINSEKENTEVTVKDIQASDTNLIDIIPTTVAVNLKETTPATPDTPGTPSTPTTPTTPTNPTEPTTPENPSNPSAPTTSGEGQGNAEVPTTTTGTQASSNSGTNSNNQQASGTSNNKKVELPKTGENSLILQICIGIAIISSIVFFIKMITANKKD